LDEAQRETTRLAQELTVARATEVQQSMALAASAALVTQRSEALEALQRAHEGLIADQQQRVQHETRARERLGSEREVLQAQLARCLEQLHNRESRRTFDETAIRELDAELAGATLRAREQEARADRLSAELEARSAQELQFAELTAEHAEGRARLVSMESALGDAQRRAESEALASTSAAERLRAMEGEIAARAAELARVRVESERDRASLSDLAAATVRNQQVLADQSRLLEERESAARAMAASAAEQAAVITALHRQIEELTARLATPDAERRALEERLVVLTSQAAESDCRVTRLELMNVELRATVRRLHESLAERENELQRATRIASMNTYALGRVQSSIDELGRGLTVSAGVTGQTHASVLTRIDGGRNHSVVVRGRTTIGRDPDNELPLATSSVSRHHAVLIPAFQGALLQDLGSTNGVLVNQRRVRCARLEHGDVITLGKAQLRYTLAPAPVAAGITTHTARRHAQQ
jgi:hypothetical protein